MKKRSMHRIHIDGDIWKWYVTNFRGSIVVFSPFGQRHKFSIWEYARFTGRTGTDHEIDDACDIEDCYPIVTPAVIKRYILEKILAKKAM